MDNTIIAKLNISIPVMGKDGKKKYEYKNVKIIESTKSKYDKFNNEEDKKTALRSSLRNSALISFISNRITVFDVEKIKTTKNGENFIVFNKIPKIKYINPIPEEKNNPVFVERGFEYDKKTKEEKTKYLKLNTPYTEFQNENEKIFVIIKDQETGGIKNKIDITSELEEKFKIKNVYGNIIYFDNNYENEIYINPKELFVSGITGKQRIKYTTEKETKSKIEIYTEYVTNLENNENGIKDSKTQSFNLNKLDENTKKEYLKRKFKFLNSLGVTNNIIRSAKTKELFDNKNSFDKKLKNDTKTENNLETTAADIEIDMPF